MLETTALVIYLGFEQEWACIIFACSDCSQKSKWMVIRCFSEKTLFASSRKPSNLHRERPSNVYSDAHYSTKLIKNTKYWPVFCFLSCTYTMLHETRNNCTQVRMPANVPSLTTPEIFFANYCWTNRPGESCLLVVYCINWSFECFFDGSLDIHKTHCHSHPFIQVYFFTTFHNFGSARAIKYGYQ